MKDPKLIRDLIHTIIAATGRDCETRLLDEEAFKSALRNKLVEEAHEVRAAALYELATEIADVLEVVDALLEVHGLSLESVRAIQKERRHERGRPADCS